MTKKPFASISGGSSQRKIEHDTADNQIIKAIDDATKFISTMDGRDNNYFFYKFMDSNWQGTGISIILK